MELRAIASFELGVTATFSFTDLTLIEPWYSIQQTISHPAGVGKL
jgi:hypothetical protein